MIDQTLLALTPRLLQDKGFASGVKKTKELTETLALYQWEVANSLTEMNQVNPKP